MNPTQTQTTIAPAVAFLAGLLAGKGVFGFDYLTWAAIIGGVFGLAATIWGAVAARQTAMVGTVSAMPEVTSMVVTNQALATAAKQADPSTNVKVVPNAS